MAASIGQCSSELDGCSGPASSGSGVSGLLPAIASARSKNNMAESMSTELDAISWIHGSCLERLLLKHKSQNE